MPLRPVTASDPPELLALRVSVTVRRATADDAAAMAEIGNAEAIATSGQPELNVAETAHWFALPDYEAWIAEVDGRPAAMADVQLKRDIGRVRIDLREHLEQLGGADALLEAVEARARERLPGARLRIFSPPGAPLVAVLAARGYEPIRSSYRMTADLGETGEEPAWPSGIRVRTAAEGEEPAVHAVEQAAFHDHWEHSRTPYDEWRAHHVEDPRFDRSLWFLAEDGEGLAAISIRCGHPSGDPGTGFVSTLGVLPRRRRQGLALALLLHSFAEFRRRGMHAVQLGVDGASTTGALQLYEHAGMRVLRRTDIWDRA